MAYSEQSNPFHPNNLEFDQIEKQLDTMLDVKPIDNSTYYRLSGTLAMNAQAQCAAILATCEKCHVSDNAIVESKGSASGILSRARQVREVMNKLAEAGWSWDKIVATILIIFEAVGRIDIADIISQLIDVFGPKGEKLSV